MSTPHDNRRAELLSTPVEHIDITTIDARTIIEAMGKMSFTSRDLSRACEIFNKSVADPDCGVILTLAGSTSAGGCMHVYRDLVRYGMVDAVVSTGASIVDMDFFEALGFKHFQGSQDADDSATSTSTVSTTPTSTRRSCRPAISRSRQSPTAWSRAPTPRGSSFEKWVAG